MAFTVNDYHDLVTLLGQHPEWRAELRSLLRTDEPLDLQGIVRELVQAQWRTSEEVRTLADMAKRAGGAASDLDWAGAMNRRPGKRVDRQRIQKFFQSCFVLLVFLVGVPVLWLLLIYGQPSVEVDIIQRWAVSLVPRYPMGVAKDHTSTNIFEGSAIRGYEVKGVLPANVAAFYHEQLSQPPWRLYDEQWFIAYKR